MMLRIYVGYCLTVFCSCIHWSRVPDMDGKEIQTNGKDYLCNKLTCAIECSKLSRCYSFSHDVITSRCVLYDDVITTGVNDASSKWRYYTSPGNFLNSLEDRSKIIFTFNVPCKVGLWEYFPTPFKSCERPKILIPCPTGYKEVSDVCFSVYLENGLGLEYSQLFCQSDDADLAIIDSERKQRLIETYLTPGEYYMIGLYASYFSSDYEWIDGLTDVNYTNWAPNEPSYQLSSVQRCALMEYYSPDGNFQWFSYDCKSASGVICEITGFTPTIQTNV